MTGLRKFAYLLLLAQLILLLETYLNGPENLAMKYGLHGEPIRTAPRTVFIGFYLSYLAFINAVIGAVMFLLRNPAGLKWANIPDKEFWVRPENQFKALAKVNYVLDLTLIFIHGLSLALMACSRYAIQGSALNGVLATTFAVAIGGLIYLFRLFRRP